MWLRRTAGLVVLVGAMSAASWSCSDDSPRDINYGTDAGAEFEVPPEDARDGAMLGTGGATGSGGSEGSGGSDGTGGVDGGGVDGGAGTIDAADDI